MKYQKGPRIRTFKYFIYRLEKGLPFYFHNKFLAAGFIIHWSIAMIKQHIKFGSLFTAERVDK